jgi:Protein of unknown function (DUF3499)
MNSGPNWARRYGPTRRLCARPGCGAPAAVTLRFEPTQREAWLVDLDDDAARTEGDLCARHAAGLVLPRGWQLHDAITTPLTVVSEAAAETAATPRRRVRNTNSARARRRRTGTAGAELPGLAAVNDTDEPAEKRQPDAPRRESSGRATPLVPAATAEASEALAETLDVRTPLLRRAFSNVRLPSAKGQQEVDAG